LILGSSWADLVEVLTQEVFSDLDVSDDFDLLIHEFVGFVADELDVSFESFGRFTAGQPDRCDDHDQQDKHSFSHYSDSLRSVSLI
jgi:hypothetical protein